MLRIFRALGSPSGRLQSSRRRAKFSPRLVCEGLENRDLMAAFGLDPTFGFGGGVLLKTPANTDTTSYYNSASAIALQSDGKIVEVGSLNGYSQSGANSNSTSDLLVERFNPDGSIDTTFGSGGYVTVPVKLGTTVLSANPTAVAIQGDGKIVVLENASNFSSSPNIQDFAVVRLTTGGALDTSFNTTGYSVIDFTPAGAATKTGASATSIALAPNGKIVVAGSASPSNSIIGPGNTATTSMMAVAQLNADGTLDTTFNHTGLQTVAFALGGTKTDTANAVLVGPDSKVTLVGTATVNDVTVGSQSLPSSNIAVARLNPDGSLDTSFGTGGKTTVAYALGGDKADLGNGAILDGNKIVIVGASDYATLSGSSAGSGTSSHATVTRLNSNGSLDTSFNGTGKLTLSVPQGGITSESAVAIVIAPDSSYLVGGNAGVQSNQYYSDAAFFAKIRPAGSLDTTYGNGGIGVIAGTNVKGSIAVQPDGKIVFGSYAAISRTTAPALQVVSASAVVTGTGRRQRTTSITIRFNTAIHPNLAGHLTGFHVRNGTRGMRYLAIRSASYDAKTFTLTINLRSPAPKGALQVLISSDGIVGADSQVFNNGLDSVVNVTSAPATPTAKRLKA